MKGTTVIITKGQNARRLCTHERFIKAAKFSFLLVPFSIVLSIYLLQEKDQNQEHQHLDIKLGGASVDSVKDTDQRLRAKHPGCFSKNMFKDYEGMTRKFKKQTMTYSLLGRNSTESVRYNHLCPYMKFRYNCARKNPLGYGKNPTDWKLILKYGSDQCNLWNFIHDLGGPIGVADMLIQRQHQHLPTRKGSQDYGTNKKTEEARPFNVVLFGNSYLRQIIESLICSWYNDITYVAIQKDAKFKVDMAFLNAQPNGGLQSFPINMTGDMQAMPQIWDSEHCKKTQNVSQFYHKNVPTPQVCIGYDDNIAVVEFGKKIRFHFVYRPSLHQDQIGIFDEKFNLNPKDVDLLLFSNGEEEFTPPELKKIFESSEVWKQRITWPKNIQLFKTIQQRDSRQWFGANNPWIIDSPDSHACMPGPPDDEVNLLLYLIFSNATMRQKLNQTELKNF